MLTGALNDHFPLLSKDLHDHAQQSKTFFLRVLFAVVMYSGGLWLYAAEMNQGNINLGTGQQLLMRLCFLQVVVAYFVIPMIACDCVAGEKERDTLELLTITKLSLKQILIEKFLALFSAMLVLQVIALPLMFTTYPLGGVELADLFAMSGASICASSIMIGWAVFCSAWCYTTPAAIFTYFSLAPIGLPVCFPPGRTQLVVSIVVVIYLCMLLTLALCLIATTAFKLSELPESWRESMGLQWATGSPRKSPFTILFLLPILIQILVPLIGPLTVFVIQTTIGKILAPFLIAFICAGVLYVLTPLGVFALVVNLRRPSGLPPNAIVAAIDEAVRTVKEILNVGRIFAWGANPLPDEHPVAWRELNRGVFQVRSIVWSVLLVQFVITFVAFAGVAKSVRPDQFDFAWSFLEVVIWVSVLVLIMICTVNLFSQERFFDTLPILLTTPLTSSELIRQKTSGMQRIMLASWIPLLSLWIVRVGWIRCITTPHVNEMDIVGILMSLVTQLVYPLGVAWVGVLAGLWIKNRVQALTVVTVLVAVHVATPWLSLLFQLGVNGAVFPAAPMSPEWFDSSNGAISVSIVRELLLLLVLVGTRFAVYASFSSQVRRLEAPRTSRSSRLMSPVAQ